MLLVDDRIGSKDQLLPLQREGIPCDLQRLEFGDFAFIGRGIKGADMHIGVELKRMGSKGKSDLLSSMRSKRFAGHQLPGMSTTFDQYWLVTEGIWRASNEGILESFAGSWRPVSIGRQPMMAADLDSWILSQIIRGGILYWHSATRRDTLRFLAVLYHWWTSKDLDKHRSHQAIYVPPPDRAMLVEPSGFVKGLVGLVDGLGWERAFAVEAFCSGSFTTLGTFSVRELAEIPGIGKTIAQRIIAALR